MTFEPARIQIFDTTLCTRELASDSRPYAQKLMIAQALEEIGVDVIQIGYPGASYRQLETVTALARGLSGPIACAFAQCNEQDIKLAAMSLKGARKSRIHIFLPRFPGTPFSQGESCAPEESLIRTATRGIKVARSVCDDIEFSLDNASQADIHFLTEILDAAIEAGADTINLPDVPPYVMPEEVTELVRYLSANVRSIDRICLSIQCNNSLHLATANSLAAIIAGARQIQCICSKFSPAIASCPLEHLTRALKVRHVFYNARTQIDDNRISTPNSSARRLVGAVGAARDEKTVFATSR